jgi:hypothetical protein
MMAFPKEGQNLLSDALIVFASLFKTCMGDSSGLLEGRI